MTNSNVPRLCPSQDVRPVTEFRAHASAFLDQIRATKRAVIALTESINMEECVNGIRATSILPGEVATPILRKRPVPPSKEEQDRMTQSEDLGAAILFVASMPARTCVNELIIAPTWNRFYVGGLETPKK